MKTAFTIRNARLILPGARCELGAVEISDGVIQEVRTGNAARRTGVRGVDLDGAFLSPGFIDVHIHGVGEGWVFSDSEAEVRAAAERLPAFGVTGYLPTTVSLPHPDLLRILGATAKAARDLDQDRERGDEKAARSARILGIHCEGPYISAKKPGAHNVNFLRPIDRGEIEELLDASENQVRLITLAPELEGADETVRALRERGVFVSMGHTNAAAERARGCIAAGARSATHVMNAMRPINQRDPGVATEVLLNPDVFAEIIPDGYHLSPEIVKMIVRLKQADRLTLVTDALMGAGLGETTIEMGGYRIDVKEGCAYVTGTDVLAGSVLTMNRGVRNVMDFAGVPIETACGFASRNPAALLGIERRFGSIEAGFKADLVALDPDCRVLATWIDGRLAHSSNGTGRLN